MRRSQDWFRQAELDLAAARATRGHRHFEWACFAAQQTAEKAVKALHEATGTEAWGHSVVELLRDRDEVVRRLERYARAELGQRPEVRRVVLIGSLARGDWSRRSDADVLVVVDTR